VQKTVLIGHPSGVMDVGVDAALLRNGPRIASCTIGRTARKIMDGHVYISREIYFL
jgi:methylitaconate Delta-isomerase